MNMFYYSILILKVIRSLLNVQISLATWLEEFKHECLLEVNSYALLVRRDFYKLSKER